MREKTVLPGFFFLPNLMFRELQRQYLCVRGKRKAAEPAVRKAPRPRLRLCVASAPFLERKGTLEKWGALPLWGQTPLSVELRSAAQSVSVAGDQSEKPPREARSGKRQAPRGSWTAWLTVPPWSAKRSVTLFISTSLFVLQTGLFLRMKALGPGGVMN